MQGLFFASPLLSSLLLLVYLLLYLLSFSYSPSSHLFTFSDLRFVLSRVSGVRISLSLSHALARARGRHPVAFRLYLSATGCLCLVAQPLYIKRQGACYSPLPSSRANYVGLANVEKRDSIVRIRANLLSNRYHVVAPLFTSALRMRSPFASPSFSIRFRRLFLQSSFIVPRVFAPPFVAFSHLLPSFFSLPPSLRGSSTLDRSDGRWLHSLICRYP